MNEYLIEKPKNNLDLFNSCIIKMEDFKKLNNLYRFKPISEGRNVYFYNKKRNCYAVKIQPSLISDEPSVIIDKTWYRTELFSTNSETLQELGKKTPELFNIYKEYKEQQELEKHRHGSILDAVTGGLDELLAMDKT